MSQGREIDVLDAVGEAAERFLAAIEESGRSSAYLDGQRAFLEAVNPAVEEAGEDDRPQEVLEQVAGEQGVQLEGDEIVDAPLDEHHCGVLAAWGLCIGYAEGFPAGARAVISEVDRMAGMEGSLEER